jgi:hypothetical protein
MRQKWRKEVNEEEPLGCWLENGKRGATVGTWGKTLAKCEKIMRGRQMTVWGLKGELWIEESHNGRIRWGVGEERKGHNRDLEGDMTDMKKAAGEKSLQNM